MRTLVLGVLELELAAVATRERNSKARSACGEHGVVHVCAQRRADHNVHREAHAHDVAGLARRQCARALRNHAPERVLVLAACKAANGVAGKIAQREVAQADVAQLHVQPALHFGPLSRGVRMAALCGSEDPSAE